MRNYAGGSVNSVLEKIQVLIGYTQYKYTKNAVAQQDCILIFLSPQTAKMDAESKFGQRFYPMKNAGYAGAALKYGIIQLRYGHEANRHFTRQYQKAINDA